MTAAAVPSLPHGCGSWVVVRKGTLDSVTELFKGSAYVHHVNGASYEVLTALDYLVRLNAKA